jgi:hypothetical protein
MARLIPGGDGERLGEYKTAGHYKERQLEFYKAFEDIIRRAGENSVTRADAWKEYNRHAKPLSTHPEADESFLEYETALRSELEEIVGPEPKLPASASISDVSWKVPLIAFGLGVLGYGLEKQGINVTALYGTGLGAIATAYAMNARQKKLFERLANEPDIEYVSAPAPQANGMGGKFVAGLITIGALVGLMFRGLPRDQQELAKPHKARALVEQTLHGPLVFPDEVPLELYRR